MNDKVEIKIDAKVTGTDDVKTLGGGLDKTSQSAKDLGAASQSSAQGIGQASAAATANLQSSTAMRDGLQKVDDTLKTVRTELLGFLGVQAGLEGIKNVADLADAYKNLEAKIKLTTGEGKAFDTAFAGVFDIAKRTNSAVEETGTLFTKLAEAGKALGVSNTEALALTETINQSIQLSGASADSASAAIQQLVQGLQSGVLRGDEFNSVMEQSPRLAKALADGIGVGTGELRKMAEAGQLTSATVIKSLQNQSDAIASEFGKLPQTVGRSMQNLQTAFTQYVGESDKAHGYTAKLASVIDMLAGNMTTVANAMLHAGQTLGAMKILAMAQDWLVAGAAMKATAASTEAVTAATVQNTAAKTQNTAATAANTTAQIENAASGGKMAAALDATKGAASGVAGAVGGLVRSLAPLLLVDFVLNAKSYGTALGEWAARAMGAKDATKVLADEEKRLATVSEEAAAAKKKHAVAMQEAADRAMGLSKEARKLVADFDDARAKGDSAADAIKKIGKDFDLSNIPGIRAAAGVLDKLAKDGKASAEEVAGAWQEALKGKDLKVFEVNFRASMAIAVAEADKAAKAVADAIARGVKGDELRALEQKAADAFGAAAVHAQRFESVVGNALQESLRRTGLDIDLLRTGMGTAAKSAVNDTQTMIDGLDRLKAQGVDTGRALVASIGKGIDTADSQKAIDAVRLQIEAVRKELGNKVADGFLAQAVQKTNELRDSLDKVTPGINSVREAYKQLGLQAPEDLKKVAAENKTAWGLIAKDGQASAETLKSAFAQYANSALAASGSVGSGAYNTTKALLTQEAALKGITVAWGANGQISMDAEANKAAAVNATNDALIQQKFLIDQLRESELEEIKVKNASIEASKKLNAAAKALAQGIAGEYATPDFANEQAAQEWIKQKRDERQKVHQQILAMGGLDADYAMQSRWLESQYQSGLDALKNKTSMTAATNAGSVAQSAAESGKTVTVRLQNPDGRVNVVNTNDQGASGIIDAFKSAKLAAGY